MQTFTFTAAELYALSKQVFFRTIPSCVVYFDNGRTQMEISMKGAAATQRASDRRQTMALILKYGDDNNISELAKWLSEYFSEVMQSDLFDCRADPITCKITPGDKLSKAINTLGKR